jgi:hypothetical protein
MNNQQLDILDIYDVSYNPWYLQTWFMYSIILFCIIAIAGISYLLYIKNKKVIKITPQEKALQQLTDLKNANMQSHKEFYICLTTVLKQYLQRQYSIDLVGATDAEFLQKIVGNNLFSEIIIDHVKTILDGVTLIKFANESAAKEQIQEALTLSFEIIQIKKVSTLSS